MDWIEQILPSLYSVNALPNELPDAFAARLAEEFKDLVDAGDIDVPAG